MPGCGGCTLGSCPIGARCVAGGSPAPATWPPTAPPGTSTSATAAAVVVVSLRTSAWVVVSRVCEKRAVRGVEHSRSVGFCCYSACDLITMVTLPPEMSYMDTVGDFEIFAV